MSNFVSKVGSIIKWALTCAVLASVAVILISAIGMMAVTEPECSDKKELAKNE